MKFNIIAAAGLLSATSVVAHPEVLPRGEVQRRGMMSKRCAPAAAQFNKKRYAQRMNKRAENATYTITTEAPYYDVIQNDTCVLTPEVTCKQYSSALPPALLGY